MDTDTDTIIQTTIQHEFRDCTVLTIAHRLETIATQSDCIMVMDDGVIIAFGHPKDLLESHEFFGGGKRSPGVSTPVGK